MTNQLYWVIATSDDDGQTWRVYAVKPQGTPEEEREIPRLLQIINDESGLLTGYWEVPFHPNPGDIIEGHIETRH